MASAWRGEVAGIAAAAVLLAALAASLWYALKLAGIDFAALDQRAVERIVESWGAWGPLASVALMVLHSFLPLPAEIIPLANGMLFGPLAGIALTWSGAMLGALLSFALARGLGRGFVRLVLSEERFARLARLSPGAGTLLYVRLVPFISFNLVNYAAGLAGVGWWRFLWTTALGILPLSVIMVLLGSAMLEAPRWAWIAAAAALLVLWLLFEGTRRARRRQSTVSR